MSDCKTCRSSDDDLIKHLKEKWNSDLITFTSRICSFCGETKACSRVKDELNTYACEDCLDGY